MTDILQVGVTSEDVLDVQDRLRFLRYFDGSIDGYFTSTTEAALIAWQQAMGEEPTGTLDVHGLHKLREYSNAYHYGHGAMYADYGHHDDYHGHVEHHHHSGHHGHVEHHGDNAGYPHGEAHQQGHGHHSQHLPDEQGHVGSPVEEDVVLANGPEFYGHLAQTLTNMQEHALLLAEMGDAAYLRGVQRFQAFIEQEASLEEDSDAFDGHVAMQVARSVCDVVGIYACGKVTIEGLRWIAEQISMGVSHSTSKISYSYLSGADAKKVRAFYANEVTKLAHDNAKVRHELAWRIKQAFEPLYALVNAGKPLPPEQMDWIQIAFGTGGASLDYACHHMLGLRDTAGMGAVEDDVYNALVHKYWATRRGASDTQAPTQAPSIMDPNIQKPGAQTPHTEA